MSRKIGIPVWKTGENSLGVTLAYAEFAADFGDVVLLMPEHEIRTDLDLLILPGGADKMPATYGEYPSVWTQKPDIQKEHFDMVMLPQYIENRTPIFGICRGLQALAVHFGGKLFQHMGHQTNTQDDPFKAVHKISFDNRVFRSRTAFTDVDTLGVNSRHHQSVREVSLPDDFKVIARHEKDNHVEMAAHTVLPIVGCQFHPEDLNEMKTLQFISNVVSYLVEEKRSIL